MFSALSGGIDEINRSTPSISLVATSTRQPAITLGARTPQHPADIRGSQASQLPPVAQRPAGVAVRHLDADHRAGLPGLPAYSVAGVPGLRWVRGRRTGMAVHS